MEQNTELSSQTKERGFFDAAPKFMFAFGLVGGVAVLSTIGLVITITMLLSDGDNTEGTTATTNTNPAVAGAGAEVAPTPAAAPTPEAAPQAPPANPSAMRPVSDEDHILGPDTAKITFVEYSDFECPFCERHVPTVQQLLSEYPDDIRVVYRHFPLSFHPQAQPAAEASECAADQGKFWEFHDELFENQALLSSSFYSDTAGKLGLDVAAFEECVSWGDKATLVQDDYNEGVIVGVTGTPATFINDTLVSGAVPYEQLKAQVDSILAAS